MNDSDNTVRDTILVGVFFVAYGVLTWLASHGPVRLPSLRRPVIGLDPSLLQLGKARRGRMMEQEGITESVEDDG